MAAHVNHTNTTQPEPEEPVDWREVGVKCRGQAGGVMSQPKSSDTALDTPSERQLLSGLVGQELFDLFMDKFHRPPVEGELVPLVQSVLAGDFRVEDIDYIVNGTRPPPPHNTEGVCRTRSDCHEHGDCVDRMCQCEEGFFGSTCEKQYCPNDCGEHGTCVDDHCMCSEGWEGVACDQVSGILVWLDFQAANLAHDRTGNTFPRISKTSPTLVSGIRGAKAVKFGLEQVIELKDRGVEIGSAWTISAWTYTPLPDTMHYHTLTRGYDGDHQIMVHATTNELGTFDNIGNTAFHTCSFNMASVTPGWHVLTAVGEGGNTTFYIDGLKMCVSDFQSTSDVFAVGNTQLQYEAQQPWGIVHDFRLFKRALHCSEIENFYVEMRDYAPDVRVAAQPTATPYRRDHP
eukprot:TRINITY_DN34206_c0_g1_i1.p1 TRINITY_DN34206_c0_g1~~TRINITY_DN34206_c0_g1_i1.p1  ORF type:complete len:472 (+),score=92.97 TRINITY_DN34206_c0_g1_i1:212-1417(+)